MIVTSVNKTLMGTPPRRRSSGDPGPRSFPSKPTRGGGYAKNSIYKT